MNKKFGYTLIEVLVVLIILLGCGGWIANVVKIIYAISDPITGMFIFRCVGVFFAPLGAILGFM